MRNWDDMPIIAYGEDGPAFVRNCPQCARFMKWPKTLRWKTRFDDTCAFPKIACSKCGPVEPFHVGWAGDFR